jgi:Tfp pilus assembly protein PilN
MVDVWTALAGSEAIQIAPQYAGLVSTTALGLAMRFLDVDEGAPCVSLLPAEAVRARSARRNMLLAANTLAAFVLVVVLVVGGLRLTTRHVNRSIAALRQSELKEGQNTLPVAVTELTYVEEQSERLTADVASLRRIAESHVDLNWTQLLNDIRAAAPEVLCVTKLTVNVTSDLFMEGLSQTHEAVHLFAEMLNRSELVVQASVVETTRNSREGELVRYVVKCMLADGKAP